MNFFDDLWFFITHQGWVWWVPMATVFGLLGLLFGWQLWCRSNRAETSAIGVAEKLEAGIARLRARRDELRAEILEEADTPEFLESPQRGESQNDWAAPEEFSGEDVEVNSEWGVVYRTQANAPDDLKRIKGIGKVIEKKLNASGVFRFAQIALWEEKHIENFTAKLSFPGRIERDHWVEQAADLAEENAGDG